MSHLGPELEGSPPIQLQARHNYMSPARQIIGPSPEGHSGIKSAQYCLAYQAHKNLVKLIWPNIAWCTGFFFIFIFKKKIKISKIYGRFENFQNYTPVENFQNYTPVAPCLGDRGLSPTGWATGPKRKKKITFRSWRPGRIKQQTCKIDIKS